jgi:hypothetical protein
MKYLENYTSEELEKFRVDSSINPRTKRKIKLNGPVYKRLVKLLKKKDDNQPPKTIIKKLCEKSFVPN